MEISNIAKVIIYWHLRLECSAFTFVSSFYDPASSILFLRYTILLNDLYIWRLLFYWNVKVVTPHKIETTTGIVSGFPDKYRFVDQI